MPICCLSITVSTPRFRFRSESYFVTNTANGLHSPPCSFAISFCLSFCWNSLIWIQNCSFLSLALAAGCLLDQGLLLFHLQTRRRRGLSTVPWLNSAGSFPAFWLCPAHHQTDSKREERNKGDWGAIDRVEIKVLTEASTPTRSTLMTHRKGICWSAQSWLHISIKQTEM